MAPRSFALRSSLSLRPWLTAGAVLSLAAGMVLPASSVAAAAPPTRTPAVAVAPAAAGGTQKYIAILRNQNAGMAANSASRLSLVRAQQAPVFTRIRSAGGHVLSSTHLVNAVIATMTASQAAALAADPDVAEVIPDGVIHGPAPLGASTQTADGSAIKPAAVPPSCGTSTHPELDPEALGNIHATEAQKLGFTGAGVTVAYLADGVETTNADFQRNPAYASSSSAAGSPVISQFDFSGEGLGVPTPGAEAFGDASSIAAQGNQTYDLSTYVNTTHPLPAGCDIKIVGVAPGASVMALKVFADNNDTTTSGFLQAIDYAVANGARVINESFGANPVPDGTLDAIRQADDAAVAAGVTVVVSTGDAGITGTNGSPATDPNVISVGASTTLRSYTQETFGGINDPKANGKFVDNNISSLSSGGFNQDGGTLDLVAPGDLNWALCSTDTNNFFECTDDNGNPSPIQNFGGTSESSPLTAGAAADVIQAYASAHHGMYPSPALVKQILVSTATDIDAPATQQGAGLLNVLAAVKLARSIASPSAASTGNVLVGPTQINVVQDPGDSTTSLIKLSNPGTSPIHVNLSTRALTHQVGDQTGTFCMQPGTPTVDCPANTGAFSIWSGVTETYEEQSFTVPRTHGPSRLEFNADYQFTGQGSLLHFALIEPDGTYAGYSIPQGLADFQRVEVADPPAGTWTAVFFTEQDDFTPGALGTSGPIQWDAKTLEYRPAGFIFPSSLTIGAGKTATAFLTVSSPSSAGDTEQSVVVTTAHSQTTIPVTVRTLVHMTKNGGTFKGVLTGGNGRAGSPAQSNTYSFDVPGGKTDLDVSVALADDPLDLLVASLIDPHGQTVGYSSNYTTDADFNPAATPFMNIYHVNPAAGRWSLVLAWQNPVNGTELREPFKGAIRFNQVDVSSTLPNSSSSQLIQGSTNTFNVTVKNTGLAPEALFVDPRLNQTTTIDLADQNSGDPSNMSLPLPPGLTFPYYVVPTHTTQLQASLTSTVPVTFDLSYFPGDPDISPAFPTRRVHGHTGPTSARLTLREPEVSPGLWLINPSEFGPYPVGGAPTVSASADLKAVIQAFDPTVDSSTGDFWSSANGITGDFSPVYVLPGDSATISVTVTVSAAPGSHVSGTLYVGDYELASTFEAALPNGDELAAIPYSYTVQP